MRLRFHIRDLLRLTLAAALAVGWWLDRSALQRRLEPQDPFINHNAQATNQPYQFRCDLPEYPPPLATSDSQP